VDEASYEFTHQMIQKRTISPIREMVWRKGKRPVTLLELVSAFEEAKKESELQMELAERRKELKKRNLLLRRSLVGNNYHKEDLEADIRLIWDRINQFNGHPIPMCDITTGEINDQLTAMISTLFLARDNKIELWQEEFPYGEIFVRNLAPGQLDAGKLVASFVPTPLKKPNGKGGNGKAGNGRSRKPNGKSGKGNKKSKGKGGSSAMKAPLPSAPGPAGAAG
jgi:hypothetical protein